MSRPGTPALAGSGGSHSARALGEMLHHANPVTVILTTAAVILAFNILIMGVIGVQWLRERRRDRIARQGSLR
jgi:hypothetical protein